MPKQEKIKLVQIIAESDAVGGGPRHVLGLLENIDKEKFETYLICPRGELIKRAERIKKIKTVNVDMGSKFSLLAVLKIKKVLQKIQTSQNPFGPMIVHCHGPRGGFLARKALSGGMISIYTEHIWGPGYHLEDRLNEWVQKRALRALNFKTNLIIAVSGAVKKYLVDEDLAPAERIAVIPNGITISNIKYKKLNISRRNYDNQIVGTVGGLNRMKGQIHLVRAMKKVVKQFSCAMLEIVGEGGERKNIEAEISELKLRQHITLMGKRNDTDKIIRKWNVFVLPSLAETFGITILEAYAAGVPVVASGVGGVPELVSDKKTGLLTAPEDSDEIAEAIIKLLEHPAMAAKLARGGKEKVKQYEWRKVIERMEKAYIDQVKYY